ncbi:MAG TPA: bifunctional phosphopantothenoylcysteine decarboxylase/phosphopantothenate--cysteine ligase CoaBC [Solibacterales bacterium]|nr:bifunctional phosphopantothenoylcysteine decarboxylase/phosphopantothenate--cysteine ligase CoaBC [Bryobacterales bacterium]
MRVVLGVGGGIAAYKAAEVARLAIQNGMSVQCVMTAGAREFVQPLTFATLTGQKVITDLFSSQSPEATLASAVEHIGVAQENDVLLVAPATANVLARFAHGIADDFLSTLYLAFTGPVVLAPAMNNNMWAHPATQANVATLRSRGHRFVEPGEGFLACGTTGPGRLAEPAQIVEALLEVQRVRQDWQGETVLVTAGPTQEPIDPVRFLSNRSSGRMGYALAQAAAQRGAKVVLISGPVALHAPAGVERIAVRTAEEMRAAVLARLAEASVVIQCAAVADYRVAQPSERKIKKSDAAFTLAMEPTPDILAELGRIKGHRLLVGFAAETGDLEKEALRKLESKNCDVMVGNLVGEGMGFDSGENEVLLMFRGGEVVNLPRASKTVIAAQILDRLAPLRAAHPAYGR